MHELCSRLHAARVHFGIFGGTHHAQQFVATRRRARYVANERESVVVVVVHLHILQSTHQFICCSGLLLWDFVCTMRTRGTCGRSEESRVCYVLRPKLVYEERVYLH